MAATRYSTRDGLRMLWNLVRPFRRSMILIGLLLVVGGLLRLPVPFLTMYIIDHVILAGRLGMLLAVSLLIVAMSAVFIVADFYKGFFIHVVSQKLLAKLKLEVLAHVERLPISYFNDRDTGYLMSRFLSDLTVLNSLVTDQLVSLLQNGIVLLIGLGAVFYIHWKLALLSLLIVPFYVMTNVVHGNRLRKMNVELQERQAKEAEALHETLNGILVIKSFALERRASIAVWKRIADAVRTNVRTFVATSSISMVVAFLGALGPLLVLCYGGYEIMNGRLTLGELIAFNAVLAYLYGPSRALAILYISSQRSLGALDRVLEILGERPEGRRAPAAAAPAGVVLRAPGVRFEEVSFAYRPGEPVLREVSFEVPPGAVVGVVGSSGAGKTSLVNLLSRLHEPTAGRILLDGRDLRELPLEALRRQVGLVSPETFLFNTSVRDNIRFGRPRATDREVRHAARAAFAEEFVDRLPEGYDTVVGRMGYQLSAGQRQRVALARIFLKQPPLLILDEATSSVDSSSEELIWKALGRFLEGRTTFVISHRLSSLAFVDHMLHLERGLLLAAGPREEVTARRAFTELYGRQAAHEVA